MKKMTGAPIAAALTAVFLAALLVLPAAAQAPGDQGDDRPLPRMRMAARDILDLTPEQEKKLEAFRNARVEESRAFRDQMMKMRGELDELMKDPAANEAKINGAIDRMSNLHADRLKASVKSRAAWESIFTPEQLEKMKSYRGAFIDRPGMMGRGGMAMGPMGFRGPGRSMGPGMGRWHRPGPGMYRDRPFGRRRW
ncbi:MAG: Spy/CpxP family protein refolding chaperone [Candidatus Aminicenantes bacterium]